MTGKQVAAVSTGVAVIGGGAYMIYAYMRCKWPFEHLKKCQSPIPPPPQPGTPNQPGQPKVSEPNITGPSTATVTVSWGAVSEATSYKVYVNGSPVGTTSETSMQVNLTPGNTYQIAVAACN